MKWVTLCLVSLNIKCTAHEGRKQNFGKSKLKVGEINCPNALSSFHGRRTVQGTPQSLIGRESLREGLGRRPKYLWKYYHKAETAVDRSHTKKGRQSIAGYAMQLNLLSSDGR